MCTFGNTLESREKCIPVVIYIFGSLNLYFDEAGV